jgi:(1->4)-alpha-D-glucan 1-alpha-D-glucosylmutase
LSNPLDQLCELYGVLPGYHDIWGNSHHASEFGKRALLGAMGVPANNDDEVAASLHARERDRWKSPLPPVLVLREPLPETLTETLTERDRPCPVPYRVAFALPITEDRVSYRWHLRRESGSEDSGEFIPESMQELERGHLDGQEFVRRALPLNLQIEQGYHRFAVERVDSRGVGAEMQLIIAPATCYQPPALQGEGRGWGFAVQLYAVRSERNYGMGDLGDLRRLVEVCAEAGGSTLLLNPLHALFPDAPEHASPYSPSSRAWFNPLYLDVEAIPDFTESEEVRSLVLAPQFQAQLRALRATEQVDYRGVAEVKSTVCNRLYQHFRTVHLMKNTDRACVFRAFQSEHGGSLRKQALFEALQEHFRSQDNATWGWPVWPEPCRDPGAPEVAAFCEAHLERVEYFEYLQWQASMQLGAVRTRSRELGLGIGIMLDLAIGVAEGGGATWTHRELYALDASAGAPPDDFNRLGQNWGLPPWVPHRLTALAYAPFIETLRANMRHSGALRKDHIMGLYRLFWVPRGQSASEGAYVRYPFEDMLGILALESQRNRCLVVGEDLGTVPNEVREALHPMNVMSTRLLYFERRDDGRLKPPQEYPANAVVAATTHDLPTLAGFWQGLDIDLRDRLHLFPNEETRNGQIVERAADRAQLLVALESLSLLPPGTGVHQVGFPEMTPELASAVYTYLAQAPSKLLLVQMEDGFGVREQPNLPGAGIADYPSWRLKLPLNLEEWPQNPYLQGIARALRHERPVPQAPSAGTEPARPGIRLSIPRATYRLQLNRDFSLRQAAQLIPYLDELGISHCYLSPVLKARPGSQHGYDITDHSSLNPEVATLAEFEAFSADLKRHGMGQILDVVPNHMCVTGADNGWWLDVLENGPMSRFAGYFDIDWYVTGKHVPGRVLLPVLGDHYGVVLANGELKLAFDCEQGSFSVFYYEHRFPVDPREYPRILGHGLERLKMRMGEENPEFLELQSLMTAFGHLPLRDNVSPEAVTERARDKEIHKRHLASLCALGADIAQFIQENVAEFNGGGANGARNFDLLHELLETQSYRLAFWRAAADEINYRRFFDINELAALRMDNPEAFESTHRLVRELLAGGHVDGLRIDHPDGLYAPKEYFERLQAMAAGVSTRDPKSAGIPGTPGTSGVSGDGGDRPDSTRPLYIVVEKILASYEQLPQSWPVHGTTGYDFAAICTGLFVDIRAADRFSRIYQGFIGTQLDFGAMVRSNKHLIMERALAGELQVLAAQLTRISKGDRNACDFTFNSLRSALAQIVSNFPVYRTYVADCASSADDARYVNWAVGIAKKRSNAPDPSIFDFIQDVLLARQAKGKSEAYQNAVCAFAMKFQQYTSPVMAKAMEDTTFYQYNRLVSLNEVGTEPNRFGVSLAAFHRANQARALRWPDAMLSTSSHDNKRSEDVRARISVLSEIPDQWNLVLSRWRKLNRRNRHKLDKGEGHAPSRNDEYLLYQVLLGIWPFEAPSELDEGTLAQLRERLAAYMLKAAREAKMHSSWTNPNGEYEAAIQDFVHALLSSQPTNLFLSDFLPFQQKIARRGAFNSLSQVLLKLTSPGVPDLYQGNEMWDFSLVDPDNRRAVDYDKRRASLRAVKTMNALEGPARCAQRLLENMQDGHIKLYLTWKTLALRREREPLFRRGEYLALKTGGGRAEHVCAFARRNGNEMLLVAVPRLFDALLRGEGDGRDIPVGERLWSDTWLELPPDLDPVPEQWINALTDETVLTRTLKEGEKRGLELAELFRTFPYALLTPLPGQPKTPARTAG